MVGKAESVHALADKQADESKSKKIRRLEAGLSIREYVSQPKTDEGSNEAGSH
jgi:hypothetical protein